MKIWNRIKLSRRKTRIIAATVIAVICVVVGVVVSRHNASPAAGGLSRPDFSPSAANLLGGTWKYMPGWTDRSSSTRLVLRHTGAAILSFPDDTQPGAGNGTYVANPPVNYYGTYLEMKDGGNFKINATLSNMTAASTVSFQTLPPTRYDENIAYQPGVTISVGDSTVSVAVRSTFGSDAVIKTLPRTTPGPSADVALSQGKTSLAVSVDGEKFDLGTPVFKQQVWIGFDASQSFDVTKLAAEPLDGNAVAAVDTSKLTFGKAQSDGLAARAKANGHGDKQVGTAVDLPVLVSDPAYTRFIVENFNEIEPEHLAKRQALEPQKGQYEFGELDALVDFGAHHNLTVHGHTLVFNEANPQWLTTELAAATPAQARALMTDYITKVVQRYDGKHGHGEIRYWDLTNEVLDPEEFGEINTNNIWYKAVGPDYIKIAFDAARAANPDAKYGFNEYAGENDTDRFNAMLGLAETYKPDYIGFQAHFDEDTLDDPDAMSQTTVGALTSKFAAFAKLGVKVRISEASVAENGNLQTKAQVYGVLLQAAMQAPNSIGFNMWGATNNAGRNFYFTGGPDDGGDDAPTTQLDGGPVVLGDTWRALQAAVKK